MKKIAVFLITTVILVYVLTSCVAAESVESSNVGDDIDYSTTIDYVDDDVSLQWPDFLQLLSLIGAGTLFYYGNQKVFNKEEAIKWFRQIGWIFLLILFVLTSGIVAVPVNNWATVRQTIPTSNIYAVGPGVHWAPPFVSRVNYYTTRVRSMTINNIQADSSGPGRPQIYPDVAIWFQLPILSSETTVKGFEVDQNLLIQLDLLYGPEYEEALISKKAVTSVKEIVSEKPYDHLGNERVEAQNNILGNLQQKVGNLVIIKSVEVVNYSYTPDFDLKLNELSKKQVELEAATKDIEIAKQNKEVAKITTETKELEGQGQANYNIQIAKAEAQKVSLLAEAQAKAYDLISSRLNANPLLLQYEFLQKWDGKRPLVEGGENDLIYQLPD